MEQKTIHSSLSIQDGDVKEMPTMETQIERKIMTSEGLSDVPTQDDHQVVMIQIMAITMRAVKMMTLQMAMATQYQAAVTCIAH